MRTHCKHTHHTQGRMETISQGGTQRLGHDREKTNTQTDTPPHNDIASCNNGNRNNNKEDRTKNNTSTRACEKYALNRQERGGEKTGRQTHATQKAGNIQDLDPACTNTGVISALAATIPHVHTHTHTHTHDNNNNNQWQPQQHAFSIRVLCRISPVSSDEHNCSAECSLQMWKSALHLAHSHQGRMPQSVGASLESLHVYGAAVRVM